MSKKRVLLLGATGSIGTQALDILKAYPDEFELAGIAANSSLDKIIAALQDFKEVKAVALTSKKRQEIEEALKNAGIDRPLKIFTGPEAVEQLMDELDYDLVLNSLVGFAGLKPTLKAIKKDKILALANKESLVVGGELVKKALKESDSVIYPIDSEHSAIFQCLQNGHQPKKLLITASGGSLRDLKREQLADVSVKQVLAHPNWDMGARITVDSATMLNKVFELIEAHYLFDMEMKDIEALLHPQSIIHSMVQFEDGSLLAQLGPSDMHEAIQLALFEGNRKPLNDGKELSFDELLHLDLQKLDTKRYPLIRLAGILAERKGNTGAIVNAADEKAIELFLQGKISYLQLEELIEKALETIDYIQEPDYQDLLETDLKTRAFVENEAKASKE